MKVFNHLYQNKRKFEFFLNGTEIDTSKQALIRIHSSVHSAKEMSDLAAEISGFLPNARIIGCSSPGIILDGKIIADSCLVSITTFDKCEVESIYIDKEKNEKHLYAELSKKLIKGRSGFLLIFLPAGFTRGITLADLITDKNSGVRMLGGAAGYKEKNVIHMCLRAEEPPKRQLPQHLLLTTACLFMKISYAVLISPEKAAQ